MNRHRFGRRCDNRGRIGVAFVDPLIDCPASRQVAVRGIVSRGLIGDGIWPYCALYEFRKNFCRVSQHADGYGIPFRNSLVNGCQRVVQIFGPLVEIPGPQARVDSIDLAFDSTTFVYGVYKEFGPSWNLVGLVGFGAADSVDVMVGYRF